MIVPADKNYNNENAKHFVAVVSQAIFDFIKGPKSKPVIVGKACPNARMAMDTCIEFCELSILDSILSWTIPKLGANVDVSSTVELLSILQNETLSSFVVRCSNCDRAVRDAGVTISPNQLIGRIIKILNNFPQVVPYIASTIAGFHNHIQLHPNTEYQSYPVTFML